MTNEPDPYRHLCSLERSAKTGCRHETPSSSCPRRDSLIDPALPEITTASPLLHHSPGPPSVAAAVQTYCFRYRPTATINPAAPAPRVKQLTDCERPCERS